MLATLGASAGGIPPRPAAHWTQKEFLITFWSAPPATDENLARVAAEGFNLTWTPAEGLDVAARHGLRAMVTSEWLKPEALDDPTKRAQLDAFIERVKRHPAMEAYFLTDEPGAGAFAGLGRLVAHLRARDPAHLAYINLFPTYANEQQLGVSADAAARARPGYPAHLTGVKADNPVVLRYREHLFRYLETVKPDLISYDHYHFFKDGGGKPRDGKEYFLNLALIRLAAQQAQRPFLNIIQADTIEKSWRLPIADEMRFLVFTTLAYGGRGISYFTYWGPKAYGGLYQDGAPAPLLNDVAALNHEMAKLGPTLMTLNSLGAYHTAPLPYGGEAVPPDSPVQIVGEGEFVLGVFGAMHRPTAFMVVNRDYRRAAEATVRIVRGTHRLRELDRRTGNWSPGRKLNRDGLLQVPLGPGDGRLFQFADGRVQLKSPHDLGTGAGD